VLEEVIKIDRVLHHVPRDDDAFAATMALLFGRSTLGDVMLRRSLQQALGRPEVGDWV